jgi:hypothetical protein
MYIVGRRKRIETRRRDRMARISFSGADAPSVFAAAFCAPGAALTLAP